MIIHNSFSAANHQFHKCFRLIVLYAVTIGMTAALSACGKESKESFDGNYSCTDYAMGTVISQTLYADTNKSKDNNSMINVSKDVMSVLNNLEKKYLSWRCEGSCIDKINKAAGTGKTVNLDNNLDKYISSAINLAKQSNGAFDPTIGKVTRLWDIGGENPHIPDQTELTNELNNVGYEHLRYSSSDNQSTLTLDDNASLDLGAIGKGIGCDEINSLLSKKHPEIKGAVIAVGGSILVYGNKEGSKKWKIAITGPRNEISNSYLGILSLPADKTAYVSTSGDYEKNFEENGVRYHHIIDPSTGYPSKSDLISVTIVGNNGLISDGLSTACFVLGLEKSLPLLNQYGAEAVFVNKELKVTVTNGLKDSFELTSDGYSMADK